MKIRLYVSILVLTFLGVLPALSAGEPGNKNIPAPAPEPTWTGFYAGFNGGITWGHNNHYDFITEDDAPPFTVIGSLLGGTVGYNRQLAQQIVVGAEGDGDWADISGKSNCPLETYACSTHVGALSSIRGRIGYAKKRFLPFGTFGLGIGDFKYRTYLISSGVDFITPFTTTKEGWVIGGGAEYALPHKMTFKGEYDFYGFGNSTAPANTLEAGEGVILHSNLQVFKFGLNYRF